MDIEKLKKLYREKHAEAKRLDAEWQGKEEEMPAEIVEKINGLLGECDQLELKIQAAEGVLARQMLEDPAGTKAAHLGWRNAGPDEGNAPVDAKAWREIEIKAYELDPNLGMVVPTTRKFRFHVPVAVQAKDYPLAFEAYLRKGYLDLGPNDRKTLSEGVDSAGGYLVPEDAHTELIKRVATIATVRANARVIQTSRDIASWPKLQYTDDDEYTSGVRMTWTGETPSSSTQHRVTEPKFGRYQIPVHTAMASLPLTNDLLEDAAFDVGGISTDLLGEAFGLGENDAFWNGDGLVKPMGVLTQADTPNGPSSVISGDGSGVTADGLIDLAYALPAQYDRNSKWYFNKQTEKAIRKLKDAVDGNYLWPIVAQAGNLGGVPRELLTYPTVRDEFIPDISAGAFPVVFGDMTSYLVVDRVGLSIQRLTEIYAETNITLLLARKRVGGQLVQPWRLRVQKIST